jgi:Ca-activated chloride channel homolog
MRFAQPDLLWLLFLLAPLALLGARRGPLPAVRYPSASLLRDIGRGIRPARAGRVRGAVRLLALALLVLALARPQEGVGSADIETSGIDVVLAIDVSGSMQALDFKLDDQPTSRLDVVKSVVEEFIAGRPSDRLALVAFAGRPYLVSPLTLDHDWLVRNLERVRIGLVEDGTAIGSGIAASVNRLRDQPSKSKVVILLTDGVNNAGKVAPTTAAEAARALGVKVYTIAAGTQGEAPMPVTDQLGRQRIAMVPVEVDEATLAKVAEITGAHSYRATDADSLKRIYAEIDQLEKSTATMKRFEEYRELYTWPLVTALLLLGVEVLASEGRARRLP